MVPQHMLVNTDSLISFRAGSRPSAATVTVKTGDGATIVEDKTAIIDSVDTTLSSNASKNATSIEVTSATGIANGSEYFLTGRNAETVEVEYVDGTTVYLRYPLIYNHSSGDAFKGHTVSYTVLAADNTTTFFNGRAEWTLDGVLNFRGVECTEYNPKNLVTINDIRSRYPDFNSLINQSANVNALIDNAYQDVVQKIAKLGSYSVYVDSGMALRKLVMDQFMVNIYKYQAMEDSNALYERFSKELQCSLDEYTAIVSRDADQDGDIEPRERLILNTVRFTR